MKIRRATHPAPRSDGKELRLASDSLPRHFQRHGHTVYPQHGQPPIDRTEAGYRGCAEGFARLSVENLSHVKDPAADQRTGGSPTNSRSVVPAPRTIVEKFGPSVAGLKGVPILTAQPAAKLSATPLRQSPSPFLTHPSSPRVYGRHRHSDVRGQGSLDVARDGELVEP